MPQVFVPFTFRARGLTLAVRTADEPARLAGAVKREFHSLDSRVALVEPTPLETVLDRVLFARPRFSLLVLGIFACAGVLLVALGVYGVLAYTVSQQTREIAIRLALGGDRGHVVRMVLKLGMQMVAVGLIIGVALSIATNRLLQSELWGTTPTDPMTFAAGDPGYAGDRRHRVSRPCAARGARRADGRPAARVDGLDSGSSSA